MALSCSLTWLLQRAFAAVLAFGLMRSPLVVAAAQSPAKAIKGSEGSICGGGVHAQCAKHLQCRCFVPNRGLHLCLKPEWPLFSTLHNAKRGRHWERRGLHCAPHLPNGAVAMEPPPLIMTQGQVIDPRTFPESEELQRWATGAGSSFYSQYILVSPEPIASEFQRGGYLLQHRGVLQGVPIIAGDDVPEKVVKSAADTIRYLLLEAAVSKDLLQKLSSAGVRILLGGNFPGAWQKHPEVFRQFETGLGGGAPWFPSTGIRAEEPQNILAEELFHTIQYTVMTPRQVCQYHNAYASALAAGLYTTDGSGNEIDGEPVPTVQADEYLAMVLQRWLGSGDAHDEYVVPGNNAEATGRQHLKSKDIRGFCLISQYFRSDDAWNPDPYAEPWRRFPNMPVDRAEVSSLCPSVLEELANGCPSAALQFPKVSSAEWLSSGNRRTALLSYIAGSVLQVTFHALPG